MNINIKILGVIIVFFFGLLLLLTSRMERSHLKYTAEEMVEKAKTDYVVNKGDLQRLRGYMLVDLQEPQLFESDHFEGAINIPFATLLEEDSKEIWANNETKVITGATPMERHEAWMLLTQMGYEDLLVLQN